LGGIVRAIEEGYPQREIAESAYATQRAVERGEEVIVGVNAYVNPEETPIAILRIDPEVERRQIERIRALRAGRDARRAAAALDAVRAAARGEDNLFPPILEAALQGVSLGEICQVFREVFGEYRDPAYV
jgi:methylmalonyl-CoA mutase N-terminal domain/subunit